MHCVVVSKIPSQLYKFVQLPDRLKEKKINLLWKATEIRLPWLVGPCPHCLNCLMISKVTMFHGVRILAPVYIHIRLVYLGTFVMGTFFLFAFLFFFLNGSYSMTLLLFWISRLCNPLIFQLVVVKNRM